MASNTLRKSVTAELNISTNVISFPTPIKHATRVVSPQSPQTPETPTMRLQHTDSMFSTSSVDFSTVESRETITSYQLLLKLNEVSEDNAFAMHGYKKLSIICDTLQGQLYKSQNISTAELVAIKKVDKTLANQHIAIQDDETTFCVAENIVNESKILKYLTVNNSSIGRHIVRYIDFFSDDESYFLVMEYIESINLKQFVTIAHQYIAAGKLHRKHYQQVMKYLFWQIAVTLHWMHDDMHCCHLDLHSANIMLQNCTFQEYKDGYMRINPSISIKLCDFGVAELFANDFKCNKTELSLDNTPYLAPNVYEEQMYDARCADMWSFGMIIFECLTGESLYEPMDIFRSECSEFGSVSNAYSALHNSNLKRYLLHEMELKWFTTDSLHLFLNLLQIDDRKRYKSINVLHHKWFTMYFRKYAKQIARKTVTQRRKLMKQKVSMKLEYYQLNQQ